MILHWSITVDLSFLITAAIYSFARHGRTLSANTKLLSAPTKKPAPQAGSLHPLHSFAPFSALPALSVATLFLHSGLALLPALPPLPYSISK